MAINYEKVLSKGYYNSLASTPIINNKLRFTVDTGQIFFDVGSKRIEISDFVRGIEEDEIRDILAPLPKFYLSSDTHKLLVHDGKEWVVCGEENKDSVDHSGTSDEADHAKEADHAEKADNATRSKTSDFATKALQDNNGKQIDHTYIAGAEVNGRTITFIKGNGATFTIQTQDTNTTYEIMEGATASFNGKEGLVPAPTYGKHLLFLRGDGTWAQPHKANEADYAAKSSKSDVAQIANNDKLNQEITNTYIKGISINGKVITYTKGDGSTGTITTQDTTYSAMKGATEDYNGSSGLVPAPSTTEREKFLRGDGTWQIPAYAETAGIAERAHKDGDGNFINTVYAKLDSPALAGFPTAPTAVKGNSSNLLANTEFVSNAIKDAIAGVTQFKTVVVDSVSKLPAVGTDGTIYFSPSEKTDAENAYDEYVWTGTKYERIGSTIIDLSEYVNSISISGEGNAVTAITKSGNHVNIVKGATFLTEHPFINLQNPSFLLESPDAGKTFDVVDSIELDNNGHLVSYRTKSIKIPTSVEFATKAVTDNRNQVIDSTYIKDLSVSANVITYTKGNGSTGTIIYTLESFGVYATANELNILDGATLTTNELNTLDGILATTDELNTLHGITATTAELNTLHGILASTKELNYLKGTRSNIQDQFDNHTHSYAGSASVGGPATSALSAANGCDFDFGELTV